MLVLDPQAASAGALSGLRFRRQGSIEGASAYLDVAVIFRDGRIPFLWRTRAGGTPRRGIGGRAPSDLEALSAHHRQLDVWAENCPENFANRAALVAAEIARIEGRDFDAMRFYEEAIRSARANEFVHNEGLANELAGRFYAARGFSENRTRVFARTLGTATLRWGADGKVRQLDQLYPRLREGEPAPGPTSTIGAPIENLDLATVIKVSQAVSGEIVLKH